MPALRHLCFAAFLSLVSFNAQAEQNTLNEALQLQPNFKAGEKTYALCAACHGKNGFGEQAGESSPRLQGSTSASSSSNY